MTAPSPKEALEQLLRNAYNEGFNEGMNEVTRHVNGGKSWFDARAKYETKLEAALATFQPAGERRTELLELAEWARAVPASLLADSSPNKKHFERIAEILEATADLPCARWQCAARNQSLPEPADCNWPMCGCDPYADKVIAALQESGLVQDEVVWRDISTAPKDGTVIFVRRDNGCGKDYMVVWWSHNPKRNDKYPWQSDNNAYVEDRWDEWMLPPISSARDGGAES